jgi:hypothetical protein
MDGSEREEIDNKRKKKEKKRGLSFFLCSVDDIE